MVLSPSTSSVITIKDGTLTTTPGTTQSPYKLLQEHVTQVLDRLRGSDILALNRRLKRAFDITELSSMSNSVIDNILMDIDTLESRFLWIKTTNDEGGGGGEESNNSDRLAFFPLVDLLKDMLKELGILRTTMNELQVEYVKKVEESEIRVEEEIIKKRQLKKQQAPMTNDTQSISTKPLSWLTNMFYKNNNNKQPMKKEDKAVANTTPTTTNTTTNTNNTTASHNTNNTTTAQNNTHDRGSTLTKSTTNSSTLVLSPDEDDHYPSRKDDVPPTINEIARPNMTYATRINNPTFPRQPASSQKRPIPHFPSQQHQQQQQPNQIPNMIASSSNGTSRSSPSIPIRNKRSSHRMHIDYEGIGPAAIRPIPSDRDDPEWKSVNFSSSWLGGK